jgi:hypothetical protein
VSVPGGNPQPAPARLTHDAAQALISARLDGPLDPASNRALLAHLATCPTCRAFAEQMEAMSRGLRDLPHLPPSPTVSRQVRERLAADRPWWSGLSRAAGGRLGGMQAAAMMLILLGAVATVLLVRMFDDGGKGSPPGTITAASITATNQAAETPSPTTTPAETPPSVAQNLTPTRTPRPSATATLVNVTVKITPTSTPTETAQPTERPTQTPAPTETPTAEPTNTPKPTRTATEAPSPTETRTPKPTATATEQPTETPTEAPTETAAPTDTPKPTRTPTEEATDTPTPEPSATPEPSETATNEPTATEIPATETPTAEPTPTASPTEGSAATPIAEPTDTPVPTDTPRPTRTPKPTKTPEPTVEPTQTGTPPIVQRSSEGGQPAEEPSVEPIPTDVPTEEVTAEPTPQPTGDDTTQIQSTGGQTIEPRNSPTSEAGGEATAVPFEGNGNGTGAGGDVSAPNGPTEEPTAEATEPPTDVPTEEPSGPQANAEIVAKFPQGAGATAGLLFSPDDAFFALDLGGSIVVADASGVVATTLDGSSPVWSPLGHVLLFQRGDEVMIWDRDANAVTSITAQTRGDRAVVDYAAGWTLEDRRLVYLRTFRDDPSTAELHTAVWNGSDDQVVGSGSLGNLLARPVMTGNGVWVLVDHGWVILGLNDDVQGPFDNPFGAVSDLITSPYETLVAYVVGDRLIVASADSPWQPLGAAIPYGGGGFAFSPNGESVVVADGTGLAIYDLDGTLRGQLGVAGATAPGWSGAGIYFIEQGDPATLRLLSPDDFTPS